MANIFDIGKKAGELLIGSPVGINPIEPIAGLEVVAYELPSPVEFTQFGTPQAMPLKMKLSTQKDNEWWLFPVEPLISIDGENTLIRRNVAKMPQGITRRRGSIKERWNQADYNITIEGLFTDSSSLPSFPEQDRQKLLMFCEAREAIDVQCPLFTNLRITRISIDKWSLPFTKGIENQQYKITAYSDDDWDLLMKIK